MPVLPSYGSLTRLNIKFFFASISLCTCWFTQNKCCSLENGRLQFLRAFVNHLNNTKKDNRMTSKNIWYNTIFIWLSVSMPGEFITDLEILNYILCWRDLVHSFKNFASFEMQHPVYNTWTVVVIHPQYSPNFAVPALVCSSREWLFINRKWIKFSSQVLHLLTSAWWSLLLVTVR